MKVKELIPSLYLILDKSNSIWEMDLLTVNLFDVAELSGITLEEQSKAGPDKFKEVALAILKDILQGKAAANAGERHVLDFMQFYHCTEAARYFSHRGVFTECHDWLMYTLTDELKYESEADFKIGRLREFVRSKNTFIINNAFPDILEWMVILFYYSRHHGGLVDFAKVILDSCGKFVLKCLSNLPPNCQEIKVVNVASQILAWTINYEQESTKDYATGLSNSFERTTDRNVKKAIALQLTVGGSEYTSKTSTEWARITLSEFGDLLEGSQKMQIMAKYYLDNIEELNEKWEDFENSIKEYCLSLQSVNPVLLKYEKSRLFGVFGGLIVVCLEKGMLAIVKMIITEFYRIAKEDRFSDEQLYVLCNYNSGVLYCSKQATVTLGRESPDEFVEVIYQTNRFLSTTVSLNNYAGFILEKPAVAGYPISKEGPKFEELLRKHYQFNTLSKVDFAPIDSMVIMPGFQHPIQSLMIKELNTSLPIAGSLEKPHSKRKIKKVLLWCFGTRTSELEITLTQKMFEMAGIEIECINILEVKKEDFVAKYKSPQYDLIWVSTHGIYEHFLPHQSKIDIHPEGELELSEIYGLNPDTNSQRMLFLNICDGATASTLNALYDIGLGASLCNRNQAVLSHIWMVEIELSLIYGVLYAHFIVAGDDFYLAYENVVRSFLKGKEYIRGLLSPYLDLEEELGNYLDKLDDKINGNIYYWGSGVYYQ